MSISLYIYISMQYRYVLGMYTFAKTFTVFLAFLHPINAHSFAALKVAWLDCAEDSVLPPSTGRSPIILSALGENIVCSPQELTFYAAFWKTKRSTVIATLTRREQPTLQFHFATLVRKRSEKMNRMLGIYRRKRESTKQGTMKVPASHEQKFQVCVNCTAGADENSNSNSTDFSATAPRTIDITTIPPAPQTFQPGAFRCFVQPQNRRRHA